MTAQILPFPSGSAAAASAIGFFVRIGEAHKKLAELHAIGRLPAKNVVIDASRLRHQSELTKALKESGTRLVLDTELAELSAPAKFQGHARFAPWAKAEASMPFGPEDFRGRSADSLADRLAAIAVSHQIDTVLAPTHFLTDITSGDWIEVDSAMCLKLRRALDESGGRHIGIDYPVLISHTALNDPAQRGNILAALSELPIDNVWIRASGFGPDAGPLTLKRYMASVRGFHNLGKPIVADQIGGLPSLAALAFGAVSGVAHGIAERERFDAKNWHEFPKARDEDATFGRTPRVQLPNLYRSATISEFDLIASAKGGRRLVSCTDRACCPHGYDDLRRDPRRHAAFQIFKQISEMERVPDLRRETHLLAGPIAEADRTARQLKAIKPSADDASKFGVDLGSLLRRLNEHSRKLENIRTVLEKEHHENSSSISRARPIAAHTKREDVKEGEMP